MRTKLGVIIEHFAGSGETFIINKRHHLFSFSLFVTPSEIEARPVLLIRFETGSES